MLWSFFYHYESHHCCSLKEKSKISWIHEVMKNFLRIALKRESHIEASWMLRIQLAGISKRLAILSRSLSGYASSTDNLQWIYDWLFWENLKKIDIEIAPQSICTIGRIEEKQGFRPLLVGEWNTIITQREKNYHLLFTSGLWWYGRNWKNWSRVWDWRGLCAFRLVIQKSLSVFISDESSLVILNKKVFSWVCMWSLESGTPFLSLRTLEGWEIYPKDDLDKSLKRQRRGSSGDY